MKLLRAIACIPLTVLAVPASILTGLIVYLAIFLEGDNLDVGTETNANLNQEVYYHFLGSYQGVIALNMEDGTLHWFRAASTILPTGGYGRAYFSVTSAHTCTGDGNAMVARVGLPLEAVWFCFFI
ncbi:Sdh1-2p [Sarracenia purpurea var. burkii]